MQLFVSQINNDIKFEDSAELNKTKHKSMFDHFESDNVDKNILKDLKKSIVGESAGSPFSKPSTPVSLSIPHQSPESSLAEVVLTIEDPQEETKSKTKGENQESDEISLLTTDSDSKQNEQPTFSEVEAPKPKRKYKPRKKKDDPSV
jgi:hypothetical protein